MKLHELILTSEEAKLVAKALIEYANVCEQKKRGVPKGSNQWGQFLRDELLSNMIARNLQK